MGQDHQEPERRDAGLRIQLSTPSWVIMHIVADLHQRTARSPIETRH